MNADQEIDLLERIAEELPSILMNTDKRIAEIIEERYDIPAELVLEAFVSEGACDKSTYELVIEAHERNQGYE